MDIKLQAKKLELIQWLSTIDNPKILERIIAIRDDEKEEWWDSLSKAEKDSIDKGLNDADEGRLNDHKEARKIYGKWL
jgi:predicted transcriptional regulator